MKKSKKFILAILIIVIALVFVYLAILQIPKSYLSEKYNLERNEIRSVYFVPPYFRNESNHSSNIFDFEKVNSKWKIKYKDDTIYVDYIDGKYYDDFQLTQIYNWSVEYLQKNIDSHIGRVVSGEAFISSSEVKKAICEKFSPLAVDMETSAIGHCAFMNKMPFVSIRCISDNADDEGVMSFDEFEKIAAKRVAEVVLEMIEKI